MLETAICAVKEAGKIIRKNFNKEKDIQWKDEGEWHAVTETDHACEEKIVSIIKQKYSDHSIITEEKLSEDKKSEYIWVIDPLDGTVNFTRQIPFVTSGVSLMKNNDIILTAVYNPIHDELFTAEKGKGAFLNGNRIHVSDREFQLSTISYSRKAAIYVSPLMGKVPAIYNFGCAHMHICYIACGRLDGFIGEDNGPWDYAPYLLIQEAGGRVTNIEGKEMDIFGKNILASNGKIHDEILRIISK